MILSRIFAIFALWAGVGVTNAEVTVDDSLGSAINGSVTPTNGTYTITESHGITAGSNLFHSFSAFNVDSGETARFTATTNGINNVIARVTGGNPSTINGAIVSDIPGANLWLLNPKGLLFGQNATLDIKGSFYASTGDYIRLEDGVRYYADISTHTDILSTSPPEAFGFDAPTGQTDAQIAASESLFTVPNQQDIGLFARDIRLANSLLVARGGNISVVSVTGAGEVVYSDAGASVVGSALGKLVLDKSSFVVSGDGTGKVQILGGDIKIDTHEQDLSGNVTLLKASLLDDAQLLEKPCDVLAFQGAEELNFTVSDEEGREAFGLEAADAEAGRKERQSQCM